MDIISKYFLELTEQQVLRFTALEGLYREWNARINLISRQDIENLYERHVLHSLAISKVLRFLPDTEVLDIGTGGGFPGVPLAILFPDTRFHLVDGTLKKIKVVQEIATALQLVNVRAEQIRVEEIKKNRYDFAVTRAVAEMEQLRSWSTRLLKTQHRHAIPNGLLALKGGALKAEIKAMPKGEYVEIYPIQEFFKEEYFKEKYVVYLQG